VRNFNALKTETEAEVKLRPTVSRPVCPCVRRPSGTRGQFLIILEIFFRQLRVCYFVAPSLTRGRVCNLLLLLVISSAVPHRSESRGTQDHILMSHFLRLPQPGEPGHRIYIPQEQGGPLLLPGIAFPFRRLLQLAGLRWRYSISPPHEMVTVSKSKLYYDRRSVGQSVLVSGTHLGPATNFSPSLFNYFQTVAGLLMWGALSDERTGL
jgi:hypothetical protein